MLRVFKTNTSRAKTVKIKKMIPDSWIDLVEPTEKEIRMVEKATKIDVNLIRKMLDDDELPRVETSGNATMVVLDVPVKDDDGEHYLTNPIGIIVTNNNFVITVSPKAATIFDDFRTNKIKEFRTAKKTRFLIQVLNIAAAQYLKALDGVYREMEAKEDKMATSTKNEDLLDLLATEKTLVYFTASLKENQLVLERLSKGIVLPLFEGDADLLEDAQIENRQAIDMADIYRKILSSMSETYSTIISNNLNNIMKFLAGMTIVISVPTIISSFLGMNVPFGSLGENPMSAVGLLIISIILTVITAVILRKKNLL